MIYTTIGGNQDYLLPARASDGYVYIVAPANGSGSVWLPETRGSVLADVLSNTPATSQPLFKLKSGADNNVADTTRGYYAVYYDNNGFHCQDNLYSSFLGMESIISSYPISGTTPGGIVGPVFMMPKAFTTSSYNILGVCNGDTPYVNSVDILNSGNERGIAAWGKLGTVTIDVTLRFSTNFMGSVGGVYIPLSNSYMGTTTVYPPVTLVLKKRHEVAMNTSIAYFSLTWNANISGGETRLYAPVIMIGSSYGGWHTDVCNVDTRYGLMAS